jgi:hypothetical protein
MNILKEPALLESQTIDSVDHLAAALAKVKNKDSDIYKRIHKLMMSGDTKQADEGLMMIKKFKSSLNEGKSAEEILRDNNFKIKSVHGTKFGTEYVMAKQYEEKDIKDVLGDFDLKFDGKSIFVIQ